MFPANLAFFYPLATNMGRPDIHTYFDVGLLYSRIGSVDGLQASALVARVDGPVNGVQAAGIASYASRVQGLQASGIANYASQVEGLQSSGIVGVVAQDVRGAQLASIASIAGGNVSGVQSAVVNVAQDVEGVQVGIVNVGRKFVVCSWASSTSLTTWTGSPSASRASRRPGISRRRALPRGRVTTPRSTSPSNSPPSISIRWWGAPTTSRTARTWRVTPSGSGGRSSIRTVFRGARPHRFRPLASSSQRRARVEDPQIRFSTPPRRGVPLLTDGGGVGRGGAIHCLSKQFPWRSRGQGDPRDRARGDPLSRTMGRPHLFER